MSEPIREALHEAAKAVLSNLSDRKGIGNELEQCDEDIQAEIGITVAAMAIAGFLRGLDDGAVLTLLSAERDPHYCWRDILAEAVLAAGEGKP
jgi:hypothetical protein